MSNHPYPQRLAPGCEHTEKQSEDSNGHGGPPSLVRMEQPEDAGLAEDGNPGSAAQSQDLPLNIPPEHQFLAESRSG